MSPTGSSGEWAERWCPLQEAAVAATAQSEAVLAAADLMGVEELPRHWLLQNKIRRFATLLKRRTECNRKKQKMYFKQKMS